MSSSFWSLGRLRGLARIEAVSYLILAVAVIIKYTADRPQGVQMLGPIHGIIVLVYAAVLWSQRPELGWTSERLVTAIVLGAVPGGGFWVERRWLRRTELGGALGRRPGATQ